MWLLRIPINEIGILLATDTNAIKVRIYISKMMIHTSSISLISSFNLSSPSFSVIVDIVDIAEDKADVGLGFRVDFKKVRFSSDFVDSP